ncbi:amidase [Fulvivirga sedimenti]|uniref:Amidase n=1 Tax=Fulvivirga sedimenti TaxID=2879465 RepID=A0A9X1HQ88_9BACT|nr:amidase [Fulvivirga sedimenti]MCA6075152.1 amidase [Fulvivirga sedimenti]MCA6076329.1 amidase [Fulvivirga sedimenti]MCA6077457.1 amidase [Fulvivirga sedimenti]
MPHITANRSDLLHYLPVTICLCLFFALTSCEKPQEKIQLEELTIAEIHRAFQAGNYTSEDLVNAYLEQIEMLEPRLNAITVLNPAAVEEARNLDKEFRQTGKLRPLHGIPVIVKDNINTAGILTTGGSRALENFAPSEDAPIIQKLKDAGAIVLAKSNMAEWAFSPRHSESTTFGTTHNPYDTAHVPAGSSGGTAAAIAANMGTVGLGTDTGNSIRGPSSHCSLVGFRTTLGLTSRSGIIPLYLRNDVVGPMCRTVEDATRVMQVMTGYDPADPITKYSEGRTQTDYLRYLDKDGLKNKRIGVLRILSDNDPDPEISALFNQAVSDLAGQGATIIDPLNIPDFNALRQNQWCSVFQQDVEEFLATYVKSDSVQTIEDIIRIGTNSEFALQRLQNSLDFVGRYSDAIDAPCGDAYSDSLRIAFRNAIEGVMDSLQLDVIVYPSWNNPAALINDFQEGYRGDNSQIISPHTGQPAFTVPMGFTSAGLPAGIQFLGRMYSEPVLIQMTYAYEQATLHRKPPKL